MALLDLATAVRTSGLKVVELPGWPTRGRPASAGGFSPRGVLCHHTGGASNSRDYVDWMARTGRSDLPAPLCQLALDRQGVVYVCAAGRANHGGKARATGPMPAGDANYLYLGIEAMNTGSEGWTPAQYDAYVRLCAALCGFYGWPATHVRAHRETSVTGKWDPGGIDMDDFRADINTVITEGNDDMPYSEKDLIRLMRKAVREEVGDELATLDKKIEAVRSQERWSKTRDGKILDAVTDEGAPS